MKKTLLAAIAMVVACAFGMTSSAASPWATRAQASVSSVGGKMSTVRSSATVTAKVPKDTFRVQLQARRTGGRAVRGFTLKGELHCAGRGRVDVEQRFIDGGADSRFETVVQMSRPVVAGPCVFVAWGGADDPGVGFEMRVRTSR